MKKQELLNLINGLPDDSDIFVRYGENGKVSDIEAEFVCDDDGLGEFYLLCSNGENIQKTNMDGELPVRKIFTIIITKEDCSVSAIENVIEDLSFVQDVELLEEYEDKLRLQIETDGDTDFDYLCTCVENQTRLDVELITEDEYYDE
jgi:hypothetical protein